MKITHTIKPREATDMAYALQGDGTKNIYWATFNQWPSTLSWEINNPTNISEARAWAESEGFTLESTNTTIFNREEKYSDKGHALFINSGRKIMLLSSVGYESIRLVMLFPEELASYAVVSQQDITKRIGSNAPSGRVNLVAIEEGQFTLMPLSIPKPNLNLELNYGQSFREVHQDIKSILDSKESGLILLHGISGSGKSTYIYHIIHEFGYKMIFIPNNMVSSIANPEFINFLINNAKESVLIIEDAEKVLLKRGESGDAGVSTLLNITDGILGQILRCKVVCTFNIARSELDEALLRKGRLRKEHEFGPLSVEDSNKLLKHIGRKEQTTTPLTLADIYNEAGGREISKQQIGFGK